MCEIAASRSSTTPTASSSAEELGGEVGLGRGPRARQAAAVRPLVGRQDDALESPAHPGQELVGDVAVHEQRLGRVADARPLDLGVDDDALGHVEIGRRVDVDVAVAVPVEHVGDRGVLEDHREQRRAAAGDQAVDEAAEPDEVLCGLV